MKIAAYSFMTSSASYMLGVIVSSECTVDCNVAAPGVIIAGLAFLLGLAMEIKRSV